MNLYLWIIFYWLALIGHMAFWIGLFNRMHGTSLNVRWIRRASYPLIALGIACLPFFLWWLTSRTHPGFEIAPSSLTALAGAWGVYSYWSLIMFAVTASNWLVRKYQQMQPPPQLLSSRQTLLDFSDSARQATRNKVETFFAAIPGNQIYQCMIEEREIHCRTASPDLDGVTITHLSDFHFTGNICRAYFDNVIDAANELQSDLILITGDIIDKNRCWDWIETILGRLSAEKGVFYILGNHDERIGRESELRAALEQIGMIGVADRWHKVPYGDHAIHLAGNELPWFGNAMSISETPENFTEGDCRILLSHSPDQWAWGRSRQFDLVLAGHTHGGQIQIPGIGPIVSPSKHGVKFASGVFARQDSVMVVSRGVSGEEPIRLHCPPEIGRLTIRAAE